MVLPRDRGYFAILFLCVPIQYLVIQYMGSTETSRNYEIYRLVRLQCCLVSLTVSQGLL